MTAPASQTPNTRFPVACIAPTVAGASSFASFQNVIKVYKPWLALRLNGMRITARGRRDDTKKEPMKISIGSKKVVQGNE